MVRTRFAPSPTGFLHIGAIRTALYAYAQAKKHGGQYLLRIEDTDRNRYVPESEEAIYRILDEYGLPADESVVRGGDYGPYRQSDRLSLYKKYAEQLVEQGAAYYSFETKEELDEHRKLKEQNNQHDAFRSQYRDLDLEKAKARIVNGEKYVVRLKVPSNVELVFEDVLQGKMTFNTDDVDEGILLKSDGFPTYHLAVVVDDHLMKVTHVFRGVEWIPSTPKHILLYKALGWEMPVIAHLPVILDPSGGKLSKRKGAVAADEFLQEGYLPEAILNFLMLLGWSSPVARKHGEAEREFFSLQDFVELFDIHDLNKSSPVFNRDKLIWFNQKYIQAMSADRFQNTYLEWLNKYNKDEDLVKFFKDAGPDKSQQMLVLEQNRIKTLSEVGKSLDIYRFKPEKVNLSEIKQLKKMSKETAENLVRDFSLELEKKESIRSWGHEDWESFVRWLAEQYSEKAGNVFMLLRIAVCGSPFSPPLYEVLEILEKEEVITRLNDFSA